MSSRVVKKATLKLQFMLGTYGLASNPDRTNEKFAAGHISSDFLSQQFQVPWACMGFLMCEDLAWFLVPVFLGENEINALTKEQEKMFLNIRKYSLCRKSLWDCLFMYS